VSDQVSHPYKTSTPVNEQLGTLNFKNMTTFLKLPAHDHETTDRFVCPLITSLNIRHQPTFSKLLTKASQLFFLQ
jgi:hypothetical protein